MGKCSIWQGRFWNAAGLGGLGFRLGKGFFEDVEVYRSDVLPGLAVSFALGLCIVTVWGRSSVNDGSRDVLILCRGEEQYLLA